MIEIRHDINTGELTGWWGNRHGNHDIKLKNRPSEAMAELDITVPDKPLGAWLYDEATQSLVLNPEYTEPEPAIDFGAEIAGLKSRIEKMEKP